MGLTQSQNMPSPEIKLERANNILKKKKMSGRLFTKGFACIIVCNTHTSSIQRPLYHPQYTDEKTEPGAVRSLAQVRNDGWGCIYGLIPSPVLIVHSQEVWVREDTASLNCREQQLRS